MIVSIIGAHGQIARQLTPLLTDRGHSVRGIVRDETQFDNIRSDGGQPALCDLEHAEPADVDEILHGSDVVVFAAGAGPKSGPERKKSLDRDGAIAAVESAVRVGASHFVIVSSMGADNPPDDDETFSIYLRAKADADAAVRSAAVIHTIVRPGGLTDDAAGRVHIGVSVDRGKVPRADVAAVLAEFIDRRPRTSSTVELITGNDSVNEAVNALDRSPDGRS
ncbi:SDR family oxidoreductase [Ilumatobacter sp.]|uniref:SDR family oxidoreductase n=1 Tax=Ilumatobacter sp. TaxID=1967498 RepID=UPI0037528FF1